MMDLTETFPDSPAGMPDIARGQCRSLSEDLRRRIDAELPIAMSAPRSFASGESTLLGEGEDELG
ncbi:MAG: hypothetical protein ACKPKO_55510, partial [Candidatus Fonsibacter sp.]